MKKTYEAPDFELILLSDEDVLTTSGAGNYEYEDNEGPGDEF